MNTNRQAFNDYGACKDYVNESNMEALGEWATDVEIMATASYLGTDFFVYSEVAGTKK